MRMEQDRNIGQKQAIREQFIALVVNTFLIILGVSIALVVCQTGYFHGVAVKLETRQHIQDAIVLLRCSLSVLIAAVLIVVFNVLKYRRRKKRGQLILSQSRESRKT